VFHDLRSIVILDKRDYMYPLSMSRLRSPSNLASKMAPPRSVDPAHGNLSPILHSTPQRPQQLRIFAPKQFVDDEKNHVDFEIMMMDSKIASQSAESENVMFKVSS
jgi:hypothetical protein